MGPARRHRAARARGAHRDPAQEGRRRGRARCPTTSRSTSRPPIKSNVRELEGALIRLAAYASLSKRRIDLEFAQETLGAALTRPREVITVETIIKAVASYYGLKPSDIKSDRRHKSLANPRAMAMYLSRHHTKDSYPDLARAFGGKHHTTVISAVQKIAERLKDDASLRSRDPRDRVDGPAMIGHCGRVCERPCDPAVDATCGQLSSVGVVHIFACMSSTDHRRCQTLVLRCRKSSRQRVLADLPTGPQDLLILTTMKI